MTAILITMLFSAAGVLAFATIRDSLLRYGKAALALREALRACEDTRELRITVRKLNIHPSGAVILRPDFKAREWSAAPARALPAAA